MPARHVSRASAPLGLLLSLLVLPGLAGCQHTAPKAPAAPANAPASREIAWLEERSMLAGAPQLAETVAGNGSQWQEPYGLARPEAFLEVASVWFNAYPASLITRPGQSFLQALGDPQLLRALERVGIQAIHTGPVRRAGSVRDMAYRPAIDGHFDRIQLAVDPAFGDEAQYQQAVAAARERGIAIIGDIIPGHTGMGADFRLAERAVPGYPALYAMSEIRREDWGLLPAVADDEDGANLTRETALALKQKGYILGPRDAVIFKRPGIKESNWSATGVVRGMDGRERRWVYLHLFKAGQPTLNWLDPSFAAARLVSADILHSLRVLGARGVRLDANMFLGFGPREGGGEGWLADNDCRWLKRGAYDLAGVDPGAAASASGLPRAVARYGSLGDQLADPGSFASRLRAMLAVRQRLDLARGTLVAVPAVDARGLVLMAIDLPAQERGASGRRALVAVNFGMEAVRQPLGDDALGPGAATIVFSSGEGPVPRALEQAEGRPLLELEPAQSLVLLAGE